MRARFTEEQRRAFVREWQRSGLSAKAFAEGHGFHPVTLCNWARVQARGGGARLVEVMVAPTEPGEPSPWAWELKGAGGELRGIALDEDALRVLVQGVVEGRR